MKRCNGTAAARLVTLALCGLCSAPLYASEALATQHGCLNCHQVSSKMVGPSFKAIAEKYRGQAAAPKSLVNKLASGSSGVWGAVPMPPMAGIPADDSSALIAWVLAQ